MTRTPRFAPALVIASLLVVVGASPASAARKPGLHKAKKAMLRACHQEYPKALHGKSFAAAMEWIDSEESGANEASFKKSKCYAAHEEWKALRSAD